MIWEALQTVVLLFLLAAVALTARSSTLNSESIVRNSKSIGRVASTLNDLLAKLRLRDDDHKKSYDAHMELHTAISLGYSEAWDAHSELHDQNYRAS